jgi:hypothetical protein
MFPVCLLVNFHVRCFRILLCAVDMIFFAEILGSGIMTCLHIHVAKQSLCRTT